MHRPTLLGCLMLFAVGIPLVMSGCGAVAAYHTNCKNWTTRTAYRSVCKSWSNGVCSFWGQEAYQEHYCAEWKTKEELKREKSGYASTTYDVTPYETAKESTPKGLTSKLISRAKQTNRSSNREALSPGSAFLETRLEPFLCRTVSGDDIRGALSTLGKTTYRGGKYHTIEYATDEFNGKISFFGRKKTTALFIIHVPGDDWPFTVDELVDWLSGIGLDVRLSHDILIYGVAAYHPYVGGYDNPGNYDFNIQTRKNISTNKINTSINVNWKDRTTAKEILCRE